MDRVVVVGGGVLGLMHALEASSRGAQVVHLEREAGPRGASVRNFGLVWVSGRAPGAELALAQRSRKRWEQVGAQVPGVGFRASGSLTVAADDAELALLKEAAAQPDAEQRGFQLLDVAAAREVNPALRGEFTGALLARRDAAVEPRLVPAALRDHLAARGRYEWLPGREATEIGPHAVRDHTGAWHHGDLVVLCPGAAHTGAPAAHLAAWPRLPVRRVRLQMMQTDPYPEQVTTSIADGDSLRYYPAFALPARSALEPQDPVAAAWGAQLLLVQRLDGCLTIGDTHAYAEPFGFDTDEEPYEHLRARAEQLLGRPLPRIRRRWAGVYSESVTSDIYHRSAPAPGVLLVTGPGGRGMTCSPGIAAETFEAAGC